MEQKSETTQMPEKKGYSNAEILSIESDRQQPETWNVVHLLRDGNYWHANEWSGWLVAVVIHNEMKRRNPGVERIAPTPVKRYVKSVSGECVFVGFQEKSFAKYLPTEMQLSWEPVDNIRIDVSIELPDELGEISYERLHSAYQRWKDSLPLSKDKTKKGPGSEDAVSLLTGNTSGIMAILTKVLSFQLNRHTPQQAHDFIGELQQELLSHF